MRSICLRDINTICGTVVFSPGNVKGDLEPLVTSYTSAVSTLNANLGHPDTTV